MEGASIISAVFWEAVSVVLSFFDSVCLRALFSGILKAYDATACRQVVLCEISCIKQQGAILVGISFIFPAHVHADNEFAAKSGMLSRKLHELTLI